MDDLRLHAYYYSFAPTGQREVDLILHAVARAGKAFHHTSQWADDEMEGFYEHCEGDTCEQWIQNAANKAAAELATLRAENDRLRAAGRALLACPHIAGRDTEAAVAEMRDALKEGSVLGAPIWARGGDR